MAFPSRILPHDRPGPIVPIPASRLTQANDAPIDPSGDYVLYWMVAFRRPRFNFALEHAVDRAKELGKPLVVFEPLRVRYRWASDRLHQFVVEGMRDNEAAFRDLPVTYFPYVELKSGDGAPLLRRLAKAACTVVTDEYPCFFLPQLVKTVRHRLPVRLELVDSNGLVPLRMADRTFTVAHSYRRWMQKQIVDLLLQMPKANPLARVKLPQLATLAPWTTRRWRPDVSGLLDGGLQRLAIDHGVLPKPAVARRISGSVTALEAVSPPASGGIRRESQPSRRFRRQRVEPVFALRPHLGPRNGE